MTGSQQTVGLRLSVDDLPMFFTADHAALAERLRRMASELGACEAVAGDEATRDRAAVEALAAAGWFSLAVPSALPADHRGLCVARELLGYVSPRADSIFAVQGLGLYPVLLAQSTAASTASEVDVETFRTGQAIAAFALTEPGAGSDVAAIATSATRAPGGWRLSGEKCFISNLGVASHATVFATVDPALRHKGLTAFWVPLNAPGVTVIPEAATAPHPIGRLLLQDVFVSDAALIGERGAGFTLAMSTLDTFRASVGAAAVGMSRRAFDEAITHVRRRVQFGKPLSEQPLVQAHLADMLVDLDAARLLVLRAAWSRDHQRATATHDVSIGKLAATEAAHRVVDRAVQLLGGLGVMHGSVVEHLYRAIRPLRIYEGTSEIQRTIIGRALTRSSAR